jgi:ubiquinone/menaquinone biosynthesis C-methylase UbiE
MFPGLPQPLRTYLSRRFGNRAPPASLVKDRMVAEPWFVDLVNVEGSDVTVEGWSFPHAEATEFFLNDTRFESVDYPRLRAGVGEQFWQRRNSEMSGFLCRSTAIAHAYPNGVMKVSRSGDASRIDSGRNAWYFPDQRAHAVVPDADRRFRVIGNHDLASFLYTGATDLYRVNELVRSMTGKALWVFDSVLDWGVGCGRLARHFPAQHSAALTGCDIDHDNVEWCQANLKGRFVTSALEPPLPFADNTFDIVYGVSVFTHLREALQDKWLAELRRITKIGALVLTTVHGETAVEFFRLRPREYANLKASIRRKGLIVSSSNVQLEGYVEEPREYVNVFHDREYIEGHWSSYFDVLHVIPGYIFTHDMVVLRRR